MFSLGLEMRWREGRVLKQPGAVDANETAPAVSLPDRPGFAVAPRITMPVYGLLLIMAVMTPHLAQAQAPANVVASSPAAVTTQVTALSSMELWLAGVIILFGFVVLLMQFALLRRTEPTSGRRPASVYRHDDHYRHPCAHRRRIFQPADCPGTWSLRHHRRLSPGPY